MNHRWLTIIVTTFLAVIVFLFFWMRLQPVWEPESDSEETTALNQQTTATPTVTFVNPKKGAAEPKVTVVLFSDFQCQPCKDMADNLDVLLRTVPEVQVVWKDMPNESAHELSVPAAIAARCADDQGKFWEYHDMLFDRQVLLDESMLVTIASEVGLDTTKFQTCLDNQDPLPLVRKDYEEAVALAVTATPTIFIGKDRTTGLLSADEIIAAVNKQLSTEE
ncbi:MAG: DsbA family protein [Patescibacteria group bacterium]|jgi:protein-disulfide isomerase